MRNLPKIRSFSLLLLVALLFNVMLPFFAGNTQARQSPALFGDKILICTGNNFKWVTLADLQSGKEKSKSHSDNKCPHCDGVRHGAKDVVLTSAVAPVYIRAHNALFFTNHDSATLLHLASFFRVRAPPVSFII